jgi:hypothetical protein
MSWKGFGRKQLQSCKVISRHLLGGLRKTTTSDITASALAKILTQFLPNTSLERYLKSNLLVDKDCIPVIGHA